MRPVNRFAALAVVILVAAFLQACRHPLAIEGQGDIIDTAGSAYGCTLEQFRAEDVSCTENEVAGDYFVNYKAQPRPGWRFLRWEGPCAPDSDFQHCRLGVAGAQVQWWDANYPDLEIPPSTAVFQPIEGMTGYLTAPAIAGVAYATATQQGVTGEDGNFQYLEGESVRFTVGDTLLGEVSAREHLTLFDLADAPVISGTGNIQRALAQGGDSFRVMANIAVLLYSLDHDAEPDNGIQVRAGVAVLFQGVSLDLDQYWQDFREDFGLRHAMGLANSKHRFSVIHGVAKPAQVMQHLYQQLDLDARTSAASRELRDDGGGGGPENTRTFSYDDRGNRLQMLSQEGDRAAGFYREYISNYQYNGRDNLVAYTEREIYWFADFEGHGETEITIAGKTTYTYDALDNRVSRSTGYAGDDGPDSSENWQYDVDNNIVRHEEIYHYESEVGAVQTWHYDTGGRLTLYREYGQGDGMLDVVEDYTYDAGGALIRIERRADQDGDGALEKSVGVYHNDAHGRAVRYEQDDNGDARADRIEYYEYDPRGNRTRMALDNSGDGPLERVERWHYDSADRLLRQELDWWPVGSLNGIERWQYDERGNQARYERDESANGTLNWVETFEYDQHGNLVIHESLDEDATIFFEKWQYDIDGNVTRYESGCRDGLCTGPNRHTGPVYSYEYQATGWGQVFQPGGASQQPLWEEPWPAVP